jgi:hypothetical protein
MQFDAYSSYGGFEEAAAAARSRDSLLAIQTELFLCARACRHIDDADALLEAWKELHPLFVHFADRSAPSCTPSP